MSESFNDLINQANQSIKEIHQDVPDTLQAFSQLGAKAGADGALSAKTKELIALGVIVNKQCDSCIAFHMKKLIKLGATRAEISEALGMAVYLGGGPALMYAAKAMQAYQEFSA